jgi:hypothetical protein
MLSSELKSIDAWRARAPHLHIEDAAFLRAHVPIAVPPQQKQSAAESIKFQGYLQGNVGNWGIDLSAMANTVRALSAANVSPVFAFLYDEFWLPFYKLHDVYTGLLGGKYFMLPDCWIWNVDPRRGEAGWAPHRDKGSQSLFEDRMPKSLTTWIPLSPATPLNGCIYIVPANLDPTYGTEQDGEWKFELPSVRALPGVPGDFFIWNQAVLHWGGRSSPQAPGSRVSMALEFQRADIPPYNQPLIDPQRMLTFEQRLMLVAKQILQYKHMYKLAPEIEKMAVELRSTSS